MAHIPRLTMIGASCAITLFNICTLCFAQADISRNLVRDPVELGNPYNVMNNRDIHSIANAIQRKHPNHHRHQLPPHENSEEQALVVPFATEPISVARDDSGRGNVRTSSPNSHIRLPTKVLSTEEDEECPMCAAARKNSRLDDETLRAVRVEIVKRQILEKLRLKEPPKIDNIPRTHHTALPPIALGNPVFSNNVRNEHDDIANLDLEDFYGKPEQTIVLPQVELSDCSSWSTSPHSEAASCFVFKLPKEVRSNHISSAELWVYQLPESDSVAATHRHHNFSISEMMTVSNYRVSSPGKRRGSPHFNTIIDRHNVPETEDWINFNLTDRARKWLSMDAHEHTIKISCSSCNLDANEFPIGNSGEQQPFIVFNIANGRKRRRHRRSLNCTPGVTECCRESLYISFKEIKWDWILEPEGFNAYYCKGVCHGDVALARTETHHSRVMIDLVKQKGGVNNSTEELVPCCTATEMSSISLLYRDPESYNTTLQHVKLPNMVVEKCGCK